MAIEILIDGMRCKNCVGHVEKALNAQNGVLSVAVSLENRNAIVEIDSDKLSPESLVAVIEDEGYNARLSFPSRA